MEKAYQHFILLSKSYHFQSTLFIADCFYPKTQFSIDSIKRQQAPHSYYSKPLEATKVHSQPLTTTHNYSQPLTTTCSHSYNTQSHSLFGFLESGCAKNSLHLSLVHSVQRQPQDRSSYQHTPHCVFHSRVRVETVVGVDK